MLSGTKQNQKKRKKQNENKIMEMAWGEFKRHQDTHCFPLRIEMKTKMARHVNIPSQFSFDCLFNMYKKLSVVIYVSHQSFLNEGRKREKNENTETNTNIIHIQLGN